MTSAVSIVVEGARAGSGPQLVEARTHRLSGHYDLDPQTYRPEGELEKAREAEPVARLAAALGSERSDAIRAEVNREVETAIDEARAVPVPDPQTVRSHLYA